MAIAVAHGLMTSRLRVREGPPLPKTSYDYPGGNGDRRGLVAMSANIGVLGGTLENLLDGESSNAFWTPSVEGDSRRFILFDFGSPKEISAATFDQGCRGKWRFEVSNDAANFQSFSDEFEWQTGEVVLNNGGIKFRFYRMLHVSGKTNAGPHCKQVRFCISK